jgi:hypothetical protein
VAILPERLVLSALTTGYWTHCRNKKVFHCLTVSLPLLLSLLISNIFAAFLFPLPMPSSYALQYDYQVIIYISPTIIKRMTTIKKTNKNVQFVSLRRAGKANQTCDCI